ncbi:ribosomal protein S5 domain 2-type protein [Trichophaea hybrida]|nr:ribosomal protein S5 domain 2-type protein [Trichophaea hybrida]
MNDDLSDEIQALNAIYDSECLINSPDDANVYTFQPPTSVVSPQLRLRLHIPPTYPQHAPKILDAGSIGAVLANEVLRSVWRDGEVCLYDLVEGLREVLGGEEREESERQSTTTSTTTTAPPLPYSREPSPPAAVIEKLLRLPTPDDATAADPWIIAPALTEKKSTFVARCIGVTTAMEAQHLITSILTDKKLQKATHNISAYRIVRENGTVIQDNDDDGETAAGSRLAHLLQVMEVKDVLVVVSRWYGGIKLGPDRFRYINTAARESLVLGVLWRRKRVRALRGKRKSRYMHAVAGALEVEETVDT